MPGFSNEVYRLIILIEVILQIALLLVMSGIQVYMRMHIICRNDERAANLQAFAFILNVLALQSWIRNWGFLRQGLMIVSLPLLHSALFLFVNLFAGYRLGKSKSMRILTALSFITFAAAYLLFPDGVGEGGLYVFFHIIKDHTIAFVCGLISVVAFGVNLIVCILQLFVTSRTPVSDDTDENVGIDVTDIVRQIDEEKITSADICE